MADTAHQIRMLDLAIRANLRLIASRKRVDIECRDSRRATLAALIVERNALLQAQR